MSIFDTGKSSGSQTTVPYMTQGQQSMLQGQTDLATGTMLPTYKNFATGATDMYNTTLPGAQQAAQNLASTAGGVQNLAGGFGGSALQTGVQGLQSMFDPGYVQSQIAAVQGPAQLQYQQNLAGQNAGFGGAGQMGSARQALANTQLAQSNAINQAALGANIENQIRNQQAIDRLQAFPMAATMVSSNWALQRQAILWIFGALTKMRHLPRVYWPTRAVLIEMLSRFQLSQQ